MVNAVTLVNIDTAKVDLDDARADRETMHKNF